MFQCQDCKPPYRDADDHADDDRQIKKCNWLDWMIRDNDGVCLHCRGPVTHFTPSPLGAMLDAM